MYCMRICMCCADLQSECCGLYAAMMDESSVSDISLELTADNCEKCEEMSV